MKQHLQQIHSRLLSFTLSSLIVAGAGGIGFATAAMAAGIAAGGGAGSRAGDAEAHMSAAGLANSNAQSQAGATQGADRAAARMSPTGADMKASGTDDPEAIHAAARRKR